MLTFPALNLDQRTSKRRRYACFVADVVGKTLAEDRIRTPHGRRSMSGLGHLRKWRPPWPCPVYPRKQTSRGQLGMSVKCHKRKSGALFDDLVGAGEQCRRNLDTDRFRGFQIDDQLELGRHLDRKVGWIGTLEDTIDIGRCLPILIE
jgi:hypothetical protein